jgi:phosphatidylglycerophosphate synthase
MKWFWIVVECIQCLGECTKFVNRVNCRLNGGVAVIWNCLTIRSIVSHLFWCYTYAIKTIHITPYTVSYVLAVGQMWPISRMLCTFLIGNQQQWPQDDLIPSIPDTYRSVNILGHLLMVMGQRLLKQPSEINHYQLRAGYGDAPSRCVVIMQAVLHSVLGNLIFTCESVITWNNTWKCNKKYCFKINHSFRRKQIHIVQMWCLILIIWPHWYWWWDESIVIGGSRGGLS